MTDYEHLLIDRAAEGVNRITLNRPDRRNAISNALRAELFEALQAADVDDEVHVSIIRGAGPCFSSGYDLKSDLGADRPYFTAQGGANWARHITQGWLSIWDLAKPVIAQIHGYAMAGGTELAAACDLVYIADDATISHPVVRLAGTPDFGFHPWLVGLRASMEMMLTGDKMSAAEAVQVGYANRAYPADDLDASVLAIAERIAGVPHELLQLNKRWVHQSLEVMGARAAIRSVPDVQAIVGHIPAIQEHISNLTENVKAEAAKAPPAPATDD